MKYRHYGKTLERMIKKAVEMEEGEKKDQLIQLLVNQMKKSYAQWNREPDDGDIIRDLFELSEGKIKLDPKTYVLQNVKPTPNISRQRSREINNQRRRRR